MFCLQSIEDFLPISCFRTASDDLVLYFWLLFFGTQLAHFLYYYIDAMFLCVLIIIRFLQFFVWFFSFSLSAPFFNGHNYTCLNFLCYQCNVERKKRKKTLYRIDQPTPKKCAIIVIIIIMIDRRKRNENKYNAEQLLKFHQETWDTWSAVNNNNNNNGKRIWAGAHLMCTPAMLSKQPVICCRKICAHFRICTLASIPRLKYANQIRTNRWIASHSNSLALGGAAHRDFLVSIH